MFFAILYIVSLSSITIFEYEALSKIRIKFNYYTNINFMPGFSEPGMIVSIHNGSSYNYTCYDLKECTYLTCAQDVYYYSVQNGNCSYSEDNMLREPLYKNVHIFLSIASYFILVFFILIVIIIILMLTTSKFDKYFIRKEFVIAYHLLSIIFVLSGISVIIFLDQTVSYMRPSLPDYIIDSVETDNIISYILLIVEMLMVLIVPIFDTIKIIKKSHGSAYMDYIGTGQSARELTWEVENKVKNNDDVGSDGDIIYNKIGGMTYNTQQTSDTGAIHSEFDWGDNNDINSDSD